MLRILRVPLFVDALTRVSGTHRRHRPLPRGKAQAVLGLLVRMPRMSQSFHNSMPNFFNPSGIRRRSSGGKVLIACASPVQPWHPK